jgi:hypothetical protein
MMPDRDDREELGTTGERREAEARSTPPEKPHQVDGEKEGSVQEDHEGEEGRASLPATAHGEDKHEAASRTDPESMYEDRPEEDKDTAPEDVVEGDEKG